MPGAVPANVNAPAAGSHEPVGQWPLAQPIGELLQGSLAIKQRVRNVRRLQLVF
ncbi:hypothetical protein Cenrod_2709 [Candidatus Symbiobacter mobilis CR]|uniref:Uncharacterized protein n=1 Tax=Candidatus Symbiobacter mobilis CR TaxID=946483 RepID=U5NBQ6_9BURK|nr:hypothetical protein Cenrod_2709 [Candidatus Symbiobacter mobilis CR]